MSESGLSTPKEAVNVRDNRFERWLRRRRSNGLILIAGALAFLFVLDSVFAFALVWSGAAGSGKFYVTDFAWSMIAAKEQATLPVLREILPNRPRLYHAYNDRWEADGLLGWRMVRNFLFIERKKAGTFWFMTNDQGFPPVAEGLMHYATPKPDGVFRVIVLGGSTVEGLGAPTPLDSLPGKLQATLEAALESARGRHPASGVDRVEVVNAGVDGYSSDDEYLYLLADLVRLQPDLVIAYDGWNDAEMLPMWTQGVPKDAIDRARPYRTGPKQHNGDRINAVFTPGGALGFAAAIPAQHALRFLDGFATFGVLHQLLKRSMDRLSPDPPFDEAGPAEAARFYIDNRERMLFLARQYKIRFASVLQPVMGVDDKDYAAAERPHWDEIGPTTAMRERQGFYAAVRPLLQGFKAAHPEADVCVADISRGVFKDHAEPLYFDDGHLLPNGNAIVADRLLSELRGCGLLPF